MALTRSQVQTSESTSPLRSEGSHEGLSSHVADASLAWKAVVQQVEHNHENLPVDSLSSLTSSQNAIKTMISSLDSVQIQDHCKDASSLDKLLGSKLSQQSLPRMKSSSNVLSMTTRDSWKYSNFKPYNAPAKDFSSIELLPPMSLSQDKSKYFAGFTIHRVNSANLTEPSVDRFASRLTAPKGCHQQISSQSVAARGAAFPVAGGQIPLPFTPKPAAPQPTTGCRVENSESLEVGSTPPSAKAFRQHSATPSRHAIRSAQPNQENALGLSVPKCPPSKARRVLSTISNGNAMVVSSAQATPVPLPGSKVPKTISNTIKKEVSFASMRANEAHHKAFPRSDSAAGNADSEQLGATGVLPRWKPTIEIKDQGGKQLLPFMPNDAPLTHSKYTALGHSTTSPRTPPPPMMPNRHQRDKAWTAEDFHSPVSQPIAVKQTANLAQCSVVVSDASVTPRCVNLESTPSPYDSRFNLQPPTLSRQASNTYEDAMPLMPVKAGNRRLSEIDVEAFMRSVAGSPAAATKKRSKPCESTALRPPALQPRISSSSYSFDDMKGLSRPVPVKCYSFGSPQPLCQLLTPTPIKTKPMNKKTPQNLTPPRITRTASTDIVGLPANPDDLLSPNLIANMPASTLDLHDFFLQAPPSLLRRASSNAHIAKRQKISDYDELMGGKEADFWCTDLMATFGIDLE